MLFTPTTDIAVNQLTFIKLPRNYKAAALTAFHNARSSQQANNSANGVNLSVWMPDKFATSLFRDPPKDEDDHWTTRFYDQHCNGCTYNFSERDATPSERDAIIEIVQENAAPTERLFAISSSSSLVVQSPCSDFLNEEYDDNSYEHACAHNFCFLNLELASSQTPNSPSAIRFDHRALRFTLPIQFHSLVIFHPIQVCVEFVLDTDSSNGSIGTSIARPAMNAYSDMTICWGDREMEPDGSDALIYQIEAYVSSYANNDLEPLDRYIRHHSNDVILERTLTPSNAVFIPPGMDAIALVSNNHQEQLALTLALCGMPVFNNSTAIALRKGFTPDGNEIWLSQTDKTGRVLAFLAADIHLLQFAGQLSIEEAKAYLPQQPSISTPAAS